ncbi:hypothetical protein LCGC14_0855020 [marine sediment metagenome]|uniref:Uncharacterized protein n=1 Tax=marine sediment metagenome TaxID=412755 RepID=A0A0F9RTS0_9ZZZZ
MCNCVLCNKLETKNNPFVPLTFENQSDEAQKPIHFNCFPNYLRMLKQAEKEGIYYFTVHIYNDLSMEEGPEEDFITTYENKIKDEIYYEAEVIEFLNMFKRGKRYYTLTKKDQARFDALKKKMG